MIQGREELRFALEAGQPIGIASEDVGQDLERDVTPEPRVTGAKHLSHSAGAKWGDDLIGAQFRAAGEGHAAAPRLRHSTVSNRLPSAS
jgi:hypothetical protein